MSPSIGSHGQLFRYCLGLISMALLILWLAPPPPLALVYQSTLCGIPTLSLVALSTSFELLLTVTMSRVRFVCSGKVVSNNKLYCTGNHNTSIVSQSVGTSTTQTIILHTLRVLLVFYIGVLLVCLFVFSPSVMV